MAYSYQTYNTPVLLSKGYLDTTPDNHVLVVLKSKEHLNGENVIQFFHLEHYNLVFMVRYSLAF